jgi:hypothetical protein
MKAASEIMIVKGEIHKTVNLLDQINDFYQKVQKHELPLLGKTQSTAFIFAQVVENFYTCLETLFLRISQYFENSLDAEKWHADLLNKMTLQIENVRKQVISDKTYNLLVEIMRFRHFKRYYFELEYDWDKLDYICHKYEEADRLIRIDLAKFTDFIDHLGFQPSE